MKNCDDMLSRFHLIPERDGRTDGQTDRQTDRRTDRFAISISRVRRVSMLTRDKNRHTSYCALASATGNISVMDDESGDDERDELTSG